MTVVIFVGGAFSLDMSIYSVNLVSFVCFAFAICIIRVHFYNCMQIHNLLIPIYSIFGHLPNRVLAQPQCGAIRYEISKEYVQ